MGKSRDVKDVIWGAISM